LEPSRSREGNAARSVAFAAETSALGEWSAEAAIAHRARRSARRGAAETEEKRAISVVDDAFFKSRFRSRGAFTRPAGRVRRE
jgi:hypothetical protein